MNDSNNTSRTKKVAAMIDPELDARLKRVVPWGIQAEVFRKLLDLFVDTAEKRGGAAVHQLLSDELSLVSTSSIQKMNESGSPESGD